MCASCSETRSSPSPPDLQLLQEIAGATRGTGSAGFRAARERCARELESLGFTVRVEAFEYSQFPGRYATPLFGAAVAVLVGVAGVLPDARAAALLLIAAAAALAMAGRWIARRGVLAVPLLRARGTNVVATRTPAPHVWLCAHLDSKSQPVPTLLRSLGLVLEMLGYTIAALLATAGAVGIRAPHLAWTFAALVTLVGAVPVMLSVVTFRSPGALDNASGVATVLEAARVLGHPGVGAVDAGVIITDAEELGLAGARAWAAQRREANTYVLNCDGVDDRGHIAVMFTAARPTTLLDAIAAASEHCGVVCETTRMLPGILTDSVAFADAGMASVTFSRGSLMSLARVHSRRDNLARLRGTGVAETASLIAETVRVLDREGDRH
ncbi:MAG TPA: M28 family peptidase [Gemmatimonadaceae bacterium]|nr:M28 family peptidase [Gemmatimonadaceae bacterium]